MLLTVAVQEQPGRAGLRAAHHGTNELRAHSAGSYRPPPRSQRRAPRRDGTGGPGVSPPPIFPFLQHTQPWLLPLESYLHTLRAQGLFIGFIIILELFLVPPTYFTGLIFYFFF